jgi:hypothetical protein
VLPRIERRDQQDAKAQCAELEVHFLNFLSTAFETASMTKRKCLRACMHAERKTPHAEEFKQNEERWNKSDSRRRQIRGTREQYRLNQDCLE